MENKREKQTRYIKIAVLSLLLILMTAAGIFGGTAKILPSDILELFSGKELSKAGRILLYVRLPRVAGAVVAGSGLAVAGAVIQIVLNNPLAGPNIIGVNAGSGFAVILCGVLLPGRFAMLPFAAFTGAFVTVLSVYFLGRRTGSSKITLVLAGVAVNSLLNSATDVIYTLSEESLLAGSSFKIGGLSGIRISSLQCASVIVAVSIAALLLLHNELEVFSLGEEKAKTLGLPVPFYRFLFLALAAALSGAAVSFAGLLGFAGLLVPHMARLIAGEECRYLLPVSALLGALFMLVCDFIARTLFSPYELPVGIVLSFIGAPFFLRLLFGRKRRGRND